MRSNISGDPTDPRHGTYNGYGNLGCRCPRCREAHRVETGLAKKRRAERISPDDPRHGTVSFYANHGCRCDRCRDAAGVERAVANVGPGAWVVTFAQPLASLIATGLVTEVARARTHYRGPVVVRSGSRRFRCKQCAGLDVECGACGGCGLDVGGSSLCGMSLPRAAIVAVGDLACEPAGETDRRWVWRFSNVRRLVTPVRCEESTSWVVPEGLPLVAGPPTDRCLMGHLFTDRSVRVAANGARHCLMCELKGPIGSRSASSVLTETAVWEARCRWAAGETQAALARDYGVVQSIMSRALNGVTWSHVPFPGDFEKTG